MDFTNPLLRGYYGAQAGQNANTNSQVNLMGGLMGLQNAAFEQQMNPLKVQQLQLAVQRAQLNNQLVQGIQGGMPGIPNGAPSAAGGVPNGAPTMPGAVPQGGGIPGMNPQIMGMLVSGDPGLMATAKALLEQQKPVNVRPGGTVFVPGFGPTYTAPNSNGTQITYGPQGPQQSLIPGVVASQTALGQTPLQEVKNPDGTTSFIPKSTLSAQAGQPTVGPSLRVTPAEQASRDQDRLSILYRERDQQKASGMADPALDKEIAAEERRSGGAPSGVPRFGQTQEQQLQQGAQAAANTEASKEFISEMRQNYAKLRDVPSTLANMDKARQLALTDAKNFMGPFGESKLAITKFMRSNLPGMGNLDTSGVTNAEQLQSTLFNQVMDNLKKMDASPSQYQQQVMQEAFGTLRTDPQSVPKILDVFSDILKNRVAIHNQTVESAEGRGTLFPYDVKVKLSTNTDKSIQNAKQGGQAPRAGGIRFLGFEN